MRRFIDFRDDLTAAQIMEIYFTPDLMVCPHCGGSCVESVTAVDLENELILFAAVAPCRVCRGEGVIAMLSLN